MVKKDQHAFVKIKIAAGMLAAVILWMLGAPMNAYAYDYMLENGEKVPIPATYNLYDTYGDFSGYGALKNPQDLFIAGDHSIYVADTGNNRILKLDGSGRAVGEFRGEAAGGLKAPEGVYVDKNGDIFIADTENMRILRISASGEVLGEYKKPDSAMLDEKFQFYPKRVSFSTTGVIYVLCKTEAQGLLTMDVNGSFRGYAAVEKISFNLADYLVRIFGSSQQRKMIAKRLPTPVSNFLVQSDTIYGVTGNAKNNQIAIYNSIGKNLYPSGNYGEGGFFCDLSVSRDGIVSALDSELCKIFQYGRDGSNLGVFGGKGDRKSEFIQPVSIGTDEQGNLLILDAGKCVIQVYRPTYFMSLVHQALDFYSNGKYQEAKAKWDEVLKIDESYTLAHKGIAQAYYKTGDWKNAADRYRYIGDKAGYSNAYGEYLHDFYRKYFGVIVLVTMTVLLLAYKIVRRLKAAADRYQ